MRILPNRLVRPTALLLTFICASVCVFAQTTANDAAVLAGFEKKIDGGNLAEVEKDLFNFVIANPKNAKGFAILGKLRLKQARVNEAKALLTKALSLDPTLLAAKLSLATAHYRLNEFEAARAVLVAIADSEITDASARFSIARTLALVGDCPAALNASEKLPVKVRNGEALPFRAGCYLQTGNRQKFEALLPSARALAKQNPAVAVEFAEVLGERELHKESADLLRLVIAAAPKNAKALLLLARSEIALKDLAGAKSRLAAAEKIDPKSPDLLFVSALIEAEGGNNEAAIEALERFLSGDPKNRRALAQYVRVTIRAHQGGKAFRAAERLLDLQPDDLESLYLYGIAALESNNTQKAESSLKRFLEARPNDALGCLAFGMTLAAQPDRLDEARRQMENCLVVNPNNFEAAYQLGLSYKVEGNTSKAAEFFEQTVRIAPNYPLALRDLGAIYLQTGEEKKARPILEKAVSLNPDDPDTHFQLSRLYNLIGERELGRKHLEIFQKLKSPKKDGM